MSNTCNEPYKKATAFRGPIYHFCRQYKNTALFVSKILPLPACLRTCSCVKSLFHCFKLTIYIYIIMFVKVANN